MSRADRVTIIASFVVTSAIGIVFLFRYWQWRGDEWVGATRAGVFMLAMGLVHWLAASIYARQFAPQPVRAKSPPTPPALDRRPRFFGGSAEYKAPVMAALCQQLFLLMVTLLMLDMGQIFRAAMAAAAAQIVMVAIIIIRRPHAPTVLDLGLIRYCPIPLLFLAGALQGWYLSLLDR